MGDHGPSTLREPIAESWRRAQLAGLDPSSALSRISHSNVDEASTLLAAAVPVLDDLNARLEGTMLTTLLVDREGRVAHRYCAHRETRRAWDNVGIDIGASLLEEAVGTNAPGTVLETRRSISIHGSEHFATELKRFSCYGHPIFHPTTRRIEGVLDLTAILEEANPLLPPLVERAVADIEQRLLDGSRYSDRALLAAFQVASGRRRAVVAIGHEMVMSNQTALDLLSSTDLALLRMLAIEVKDRAEIELKLESGSRAVVRAARVDGARGGTLLQIEPREDPKPIAVTPTAPMEPMLVSGPPGTGRTTRAKELVVAQPATILTAASALLDGADAWTRNFAALIRGGQGTVIVDGIDLLPEPLVDLVASHVEAGVSPRVILVSGPTDTLKGRAAALAGQCTSRHVLAPLSSRLQDLPEIVSSMLHSLGADPALHFTPGALRALTCQSWPGSLRELKAVVTHVTKHRVTGGVVIEDLPEAYRSWQPVRPMARIERAERDAIVEALREHEGNKVKAAEALGISRTTLYSKMRAFRITTF